MMTGHQGYNFSAGPAMLPVPVMQEMQQELLNWKGLQRSVMEISHRSKAFMGMLQRAELDLRQLLAVPDNYRVLFVHGGASQQFAMVPMNLGWGRTCDYLDSGVWSHKGRLEARRFCQVNAIEVVEHGMDGEHLRASTDWAVSADPAYLYYAPNETISGIEFHHPPDTAALYAKPVPLVADMSSTILSRPVDISRFGLIYAGAQKNIGTSGLTLVIVREDLVKEAPEQVPTLLQYKTYQDHGSLYNTPAVYPIYVAAKVFAWILEQGGLEVMAERNQRKAAKLYEYIDSSPLFYNPIAADCRSWMNVPFALRERNLDDIFLAQAEARNLFGLKGHRSVGGMRASLYNAMPQQGVDALIQFMRDFEVARV